MYYQQTFKYIFMEEIGKGGCSSTVFKAKHKETGEIVAVKRVLLLHPSRELDILDMLHHPNCIGIRDSYKNVWNG